MNEVKLYRAYPAPDANLWYMAVQTVQGSI